VVKSRYDHGASVWTELWVPFKVQCVLPSVLVCVLAKQALLGMKTKRVADHEYRFWIAWFWTPPRVIFTLWSSLFVSRIDRRAVRVTRCSLELGDSPR
jgi:cytochrome bd-type quinol oxidase subunit 2